MDSTVLINNFSGGELGRHLYRRFELESHKSGVAKSFNFLPLLQGPNKFRMGENHIARTRKNLSPELIPFVFNDEQSYILQFTSEELTFLDTDGYLIEDANTITGITAANPGVVTSTAHGYVDGDEVFIEGVVGTMDVLNGRFFTVDNATANTFTLVDIFGNVVDTTGLTYTSGGQASRMYAIDTPYLEIDQPELQIAQEADVAYIVDGYHEPRKLKRLGETNWTLETFDRTDDPFLTASISAITQANPGVITTSAAHGLVDDEIVHIRDISGMVELNDDSYLAVVISTTTFSLKTLAGTPVDTTGFTAYTSGGKIFAADDQPSAVGLYGGRLFYGGPNRNPDGLYGSKGPTDEGEKQYDIFTVGTDANSSVRFFIQSTGNTLERIEWFAGSTQFLGIGGLSDVYKATGASGDGSAITGTSIDVKPTGSLGVASIRPARLGPSIFYIQRGREVLNSFEYSLLNDAFTSIDQNILNPDVGEKKFRQLTFQRGNPNFIWLIDDTGALLALTYKSSESISAWSRHRLAGVDAVTENIAVEPQADGEDILWTATARTINGQTMRYLGQLAIDPILPDRFDYFTGDKDADDFQWAALMLEVQSTFVRCDSALSVNGLRDTTLTLDALTGSSVTATAGSALFDADDVGKEISLKYITGLEKGVAEIHTYVSPTEVIVQVTEDFESTSIAANEWYLSFDVVSGFEHLEGEEIAILGDGGEADTRTVVNGGFTMGSDYSRFVGGLGYDGIVESLPIVAVTRFGQSMTKTMTVNEIGISFVDSMTLNYGRDRYNLQELQLRTTRDYNSFPTIMRQGEVRKPAESDYERQLTYTLGVSSPNIATVSGMALYVGVGDED